MTEYPADVMPLYAQGYSLAEYLIQHGGRRKYRAISRRRHAVGPMVGGRRASLRRVATWRRCRTPGWLGFARLPAAAAGRPWRLRPAPSVAALAPTAGGRGPQPNLIYRDKRPRRDSSCRHTAAVRSRAARPDARRVAAAAGGLARPGRSGPMPAPAMEKLSRRPGRAARRSMRSRPAADRGGHRSRSRVTAATLFSRGWAPPLSRLDHECHISQ